MRGLRQIVTKCRGQQEIKTNGFLEKAETERKLLEDIKTRKLRYFGHIMMKQSSCLEKEIMRKWFQGRGKEEGLEHLGWTTSSTGWRH